MTRRVAARVRPRIPIVVLAAFSALLLCGWTGLIGRWGRWYSHDMVYRRQTDAFLRGETALSRDLADLSWDMAWADGGVQQVWGLGVPLWRFPFELLARAAGQPAFPDRIALAAAVGCSTYAVLASLLPTSHLQKGRQWLDAALRRPERVLAALVLIAFPPIIGLCRGSFNVYEEPVAYGYYYSVGLCALTLAFARKATTTSYAFIGVIGGLIGFIRPTLFVYGIAAVVAAIYAARRKGWSLARTCIAPALLIVGGSGLFASNAGRFGAGLEFGHRLNATGADILYASRFGASFNRQPYWRRSLEVLGSVFFVRHLNGTDNFQSDVVRWQAPAPRWRHFYSRTFDACYLGVCGCAVAALARNILSRRGGGVSAQSLVLLIWIVLPMGALTAFYSVYYSISSRYMLDFAPAIAATSGSLLICAVECLAAARHATMFRLLLAAAFALWWGVELALTRNVSPQESPWAQIHVVDAMRPVERKPATLPHHYALRGESTPWATGLEYNGLGWEAHSGVTGPVVMLFVEDLGRLQLECRWASGGEATQAAIDCIRARVGLEMLRVSAATRRGDTLRVDFDLPGCAAHRRGIQPVFVSFVPEDDLLVARSPWRLQRVDWHSAH